MHVAAARFAPLGHGVEPRVADDPVIKAIAERVDKTPSPVALAWAVQRSTAPLATSTNPLHIGENFEISLFDLCCSCEPPW
jgi:alcohol dehydrogenase (NADP+)